MSPPKQPESSGLTLARISTGNAELDGRYLSARLSDGAVRLITSSTPTPEGVQPVQPYGQQQNDAALAENRSRAAAVD